MDPPFANQAAWISGAASGIGAAAAQRFAAQGGHVALIDVQIDEGEALADAIRDAGGTAIFLRCDVADEGQVRESIERTVEEFGQLQIVVNCAGVVHVGRLDEYTESQWDLLMGVNVKSVFLAVKHAIPHLKRHARSYVVNVGSVSSFVGQSSTPAYTASKGAILQLTRSIALDYAHLGLRCNCVCPGITDTPMLRSHLATIPDAEAMLRQRLRRVPTGDILKSDEIARAICYFSCEQSAGVTGTSLVVDGGYLAAAEWDTAATSE